MEAEHEGYVPVAGAELYYRELGKGLPAIVLHGGPDFDHSYLLPEMDRLSDLFRLVYYDQRGRGKSGRDVRPADVTMRSDVEDLEKLRAHLQARSISLLGHSWGTLLAMEYAIRYPHHVSRLILLNPAPASHDDLKLFRQARLEATPSDMEDGDHDFIPLACSMHVARAIPGARFVLLKDCGHFSYLECSDQVGREIRNFLRAVQ